MTVSLHKILSTVAICAVTAVAAGSTSALAATAPAGMSEQEYQGLVIRSQALNDLYGAPEVTSQYKAMVRADRIRGEALNRLARSGALPTTPTFEPSSGGGVDWGDFGIGAAAMLGLVLLGTGMAAGAYYGRHHGARPHTAS